MKRKTAKDLMIIHRPLMQADIRNKNGRIYPQYLFQRELARLQEKIDNKQLMGELGHPDSFDIHFKNVSHTINNLYLTYPKFPRKKKKAMKKAGIYSKTLMKGIITLLKTEKGIAASKIITELVPAARGIGTLDENGVVNDDFKLLTFDLIPKEKDSFKKIR